MSSSDLTDDLVLSVIHKIEENKLAWDLPDHVHVTTKDLVNFISENRTQLNEDYASLDFSELREICELAEEATFDNCLDSLCDFSDCIQVPDEKIPKPLFRILERLWLKNEIVILPPHAYPECVEGFLDRTQPEYKHVKAFTEKHSKIGRKSLPDQIIEFPDTSAARKDNVVQIRSRIFEIIRLLSKISFTPRIDYYCEKRYRKNPFSFRQYYAPKVGSVKYVQERKQLPPRNIRARALFSGLEKIAGTGFTCPKTRAKIPVHQDFDSERLVQSLSLVREALHEVLGKNAKFSDFQRNSIEHVFLNLFLDDSQCSKWCDERKCRLSKKNLTIVADTGAGKTYGFLTAPLVYITYKHLADPGFRVSQRPMFILIYPRSDLAFDQFTTIQRVCSEINRVSEGKVRINVGRDYGGNIEYHNRSLITCNIEAFKRRLADPNRSRYIDPDFLKAVILDEIHLYSGILGLHVIYFLRRLGSFLKTKYYKRHHSSNYSFPLIVGASATIAMPENHSKKLFSIGHDRRGHRDRFRRVWVESTFGGKAQKGKRALFHHIFMLPKRLANLLGTVTDLTVAVLHNNPDPDYPAWYKYNEVKKGQLSDKEKRSISKKISKSLLFVDSITAINRLHSYISETEKRNLQVIDDKGRSTNFMCATIYDKPAKFFPVFNILSSGKFREDAPNPEQILNGAFICQLCKRQGVFNNISLSKYLEKGRNLCSLILYDDKLYLTTILNGCTFFNLGFCWWFSCFPFIGYHNVPLQTEEFTPDSCIPERRTADIRGAKRELEDINELFVEYGNMPPYLTRKRLAIVSPVFEVGVDISNVKDVITFKTIRDLASYKQKTGRGGREPFSDIPVYTLISRRILDSYIYRNPDIVTDPNYLDPISLKEHNTYFLKAHLFQAIFDYLAIWSTEYKEIFHYSKLTRNPDLKKSNLLRYIERKKTNLRNHLKFTFLPYERADQLDQLIESAIEEFKDRSEIFFSDIPREIKTALGISKPISSKVTKIDRRRLSELLARSREPEAILSKLRDSLGV